MGRLRTKRARTAVVELIQHAHDLGDENAPPWLSVPPRRRRAAPRKPRGGARFVPGTGREAADQSGQPLFAGTTLRWRPSCRPSWVGSSRRETQLVECSKRRAAPTNTSSRRGARPRRARPRQHPRTWLRTSNRPSRSFVGRRSRSPARAGSSSIWSKRSSSSAGEPRPSRSSTWYEGNARRLERASALANCQRCRGLLAARAGELDAALAEYELALASA